MQRRASWVPLLLTLAVSPAFATRPEPRANEPRISVRPSTLAVMISELAGLSVRVPDARVVGVFEPRVFLIETATRMRSLRGYRDRVVVLIRSGALKVPPSSLVASTVTVYGTARTVLGMQVTGEVAWPSRLDRDVMERLDIRAAVLATSVQTAEGVELTDQSRPGDGGRGTRGSGRR